MRIYFAHSTKMDFKGEIYAPIRAEKFFEQYEVFLPHENEPHENNSREFYESLDLMIAEVSEPATGLGIELGWAYDSKVPIFALCREGAKMSGSVYAVTQNVINYTDKEDFVKKVKEVVYEQGK